jgi:zinc protease
MKNKNFKSFKLFVILLVTVALFSVFSTCGSIPQAGKANYGGLGKPSDTVPFMEGIRTGRLPSGLTYFILENHKPENRAFLTLAVHAGSVLEEDNEQGLAHFVEHMAFNGTTRFPEAELINYLRSLGMRFGPEVNAYTSYDETVFGIEVPVEAGSGGKKTVPDKALAVLDDWTRAISFSPKDVNEERAVIMEEYRAHLGAMERIRRKLLPALFRGSPYAERSPIGIPEIIEGAPADRLEGFYKKWYRADNMALILVGDFDGAALEASLPAHFGITKPSGPFEHPQYDLPAPKKGALEIATFTDPELTFTQVNLYYKRTPQPVQRNLAGFRENIIDTLVDRMLALRFDEAVVKPATPYVGAWGGNIRYGANSRYYALMAQSKTGAAGESLEALLREKESLIRYGFTAAELRIAKTALLSDLEQLVSEKDRQESNRFVSNLTSFFLTGEALPGVEWEYEAVQKLFPGITEKDISSAIKDYFAPGDLFTVVIAPEAESAALPSEQRIRDMVKASPLFALEPPDDSDVDGELLDSVPEAGEISAEARDGGTGSILWTLSNGAKVILKETTNRNNEIILYAMARGGTTSVPREDIVSAVLAAEMMEASGLGPYPRPELIKKLTGRQVASSFWVSDTNRGFQGSASSADIKTLFEMVYLGFTRPKIDGEAVKAMMDQYKTALARRGEDPSSIFSDEITKTVTGGSPWYKPLELSDLENVDISKALNFIRRGLNPADYTFIFMGNLDLAKMRPLVESYLASVPTGNTWNTWVNPRVVRPGKLEKQIFKGREEQSLVYMSWYAKEAWTEELSVTASVLSGYLDIKMTEEIREKLGGVYSISVGVSASPLPEGELITGISFACDPKRALDLSSAVIDLLNRTADGPIDDDTFGKAVEALKKEWETSVQSNLYIAQSYANSAVLLGQPLSRLDKRPALYGQVTKAGIQDILKRLLPKGPARIILYPEN